MEQVFRIEIPIEAVDKTDTAALQRLETILQKTFAAVQRNKDSIEDVFEALEKGANESKSALKQTESALDGAADSADELAESSEEAAETLDNVGGAASDAGAGVDSAFQGAATATDRFTQRVQKSEKNLRQMFKEKLELTLAAIDRVSPILKSVGTSLRNMTAKAWHIAVRMKDYVTAPFRKLYNLVSSPITLALSIVGVGFSASDVLNTFTTFDSGMSGVKALAGATNEEFLMLRTTAKELGATTSFSASQAAEGMQNLASAGFTASEIVEAMPGMLDLAASSGEDLATASEIASTTLRGFGLAASQAGHVADVLAEVAARTNASVSDTGASMKYIAPIAATMGMSLEEVAASIGILADAGIKGEQAGTTLRGALTRLSKPTKDMQEVMDTLGLSFYTAEGKMKSITDIVRMLKTSMTGLTDAEKQNALVTLFGQESLSGLMVLLEAGPDKIAKLTKSLKECNGAAEKMADTRLDNLAGDMEELSGAVETMKLDLMEKLNPAMRSGVQWLTAQIPAVQDKLESLFDTAIEKGGRIKDHLKEVFSSNEFQNADGFAGKFFVAWDKIIAEPFADWWNSDGERKVTETMSSMGKGAGELINGVIKGIFAAIKGEELDVDGLNITGLGKAGAKAAKEFLSSFLSGLNLGDIAGSAPGILQFGAFGFTSFKLLKGATGAVNLFNSLKTAILGTGGAAASAAPAIGATGTQAASASIGIGKAATTAGLLKSALMAIPGWGWAAAAVIAAAAVGIKLYSDAQERQRQELLHFADDGEAALKEYREQTRELNALKDSLSAGSTATITITASELSEEDKQRIAETIRGIESDQIELETVLANGGLSEAESAKLMAQILSIEARRVTLTVAISPVSDEEKEALAAQLTTIEADKVSIQAIIDGGGLNADQVATLEKEISDLDALSVTIDAVINGGKLSPADVSTLNAQIAELDAKRIELQALIAGGTLNAEQVAAVEAEITRLNNKQIAIKTLIDKGGLSDEEIAAINLQIADLDLAKVEIQTLIDKGGLSEAEVEALNKQIESLEVDKICLSALIQPITANDKAILAAQLATIEADKVDITTQLSNSGNLPADQVAVLEAQLKDLNSREVLIKTTLGTMSDEEIAHYAAGQLGIDYDALINLSGGSITQADVDAGRDTQERVDKAVETAEIINSTRLIEARTEVERGRDTVPAAIEARDELKSDLEVYQAVQDHLSTARANLVGLEAERANLVATDKLYQQRVEQGTMSEDDYYDWVDKTLYPGISEIQQRYKTDVVPYAFDEYGLPVIDTEGPSFMSIYEGSLLDWISSLQDEEKRAAGKATETQNAYDTQNAELLLQYQNEKGLLEAETFEKTPYADMTLEQMAAGYSDLDEAGRALFDTAIAKLQELNQQTDYITEAEKTNAIDVVDMAAKSEVMSVIKTEVQGISDGYKSMTDDQRAAFAASEEGAKQLEAVNAMLSSLGLEEIESLEQIGEALEAIGAVDLASFSLESVQAAYKGLTGNLNACKTSVDALRQSLLSLDGTTATTKTYHTTYEKTVTTPPGEIPENANGGIYDGAFLSWVAEDGPEAIIPLGAGRRDRGIDLWMRAGEMLGVSGFGSGGLMEPYADALGDIPDDPDGSAPPPVNTGNSGGSGDRNINVTVSANPTFKIEGTGESGDSILEKLKAKQKELAEMLGSEFADQLEDIVSNMA